MRNSNKTRQLLSLARIIVLALCFTLVFAVALTAVPDGYYNSATALNSDSSDNNVRVYQKDAYTNSASYVEPDNYKLSAFNTDFESVMGYGKNGQTSKTEWDIGEITFVNAKYGLRTNITYNSEKGIVKSGDGEDFVDKLSIEPLPASEGGGIKMSFPIAAQYWGDLISADSVSAVFNIALPQYLTSLLTNEEFKITFNAQIDVSKGESGGGYQRACAKIATSPKKVSAIVDSDMQYTAANQGGGKKGDYGYLYNDTEKGSWSGSTISFTDTITLNAANPNLYVCVGVGETVGNCTVSFRNLKLTNVKLVREVKADSDSIKRVDNAAPVNLGQYDSTVQDSFAPYNTNASTPGGWAVWYKSITSQLSKAVDNVTYGNGKLRSYTNNALGQMNSKNYYKTSSITYHDTYNYLVGLMGYVDSANISKGLDSAVLKHVCSCGHIYGTSESETAGWEKESDSYVCPNCGSKKSSFTTTQSTKNKLAKDIDINYASGIKQVIVGDKYQEDDADDTTGGTLAAVFNLYDSSSYGESNGKGIYVDGQLVGWAVVLKNDRAEVTVKTYMYTNARVVTEVIDYGDAGNKWTIEYSGIDTTAPDDSVNDGTSISLDEYISSSNASVSNWFRQNQMTADGSINITEDDSDAGFSPYIWFYTVNRADSLDKLNDIAVTQFADYAKVKAAGIKPIAYGEIGSFTYDFVNGEAKAYGGGVQGNPTSIKDTVTGHGFYRFTFYIFDLAGNKGGVKSFYMKVDYDKPEYTLEYKTAGVKIDAEQNGKWATDAVTLTFTLKSGGFSGYTFRFEDATGKMHAFVINGAGDYNTADGYTATLTNYLSGTTATSVTDNKHTISINGVNIPVTYSVDSTGKKTLAFEIPAPSDDTPFYEWVSAFTSFAGQYSSISDIDAADQIVEYTDTAWKGGVKVLIDNKAPVIPEFNEDDVIDYIQQFEDGRYAIPNDRIWYTSSYNLPAILEFFDAILATDYAKGLTVHYGISVVKKSTDLDAIKGYDIANNYTTSKDPQKDFGFDRYITVAGNKLTDGGVQEYDLDLLSVKGVGMRVIHVWAEDQAGNLSELNSYYLFVDTNNYSVSASVKSNAKFEDNFANITVTDADGSAVASVKRGEKLTFNMTFAANYVPFAFNLNANTLLENFTNTQVWSNVAGDNKDFVSVGAFADGVATVEFTFDDVSELGALQTSNRFEMSARRVVSASLTNKTVPYTSAPTKVADWMSFNYEPSSSAYKYDFVKDGTVIATPQNVGKYKVRIYIPKSDLDFVTDDFKTDADGNQIFDELDYEIIKGKVVITAKDVTVSYGANGTLDYNVTGIAKDESVMSKEGITVDLRVQGVTNARGVLNIGPYRIVNNADYSGVQNYEVTFVGGTYTVLQRNVTIDAWDASKKYGDADPQLSFGVKLSQLEGLYASASDILNEIFAGYRQNNDITQDGYAFFYADGRISREAGEGAHQYSFNANTALFDVDKNYSVSIQTANRYFTIEKRDVILDVSGQKSVFKYGTNPDDVVGDIRPSYKLSASDMVVAKEVESIFASGAFLKLVTPGTETTEEGFEHVWVYKVTFDGTAGNDNITLIVNDGDYYVYITAQNTVIIKAKDGAKFEFVFGDRWTNTSLLFDETKFDVSGASADFTSVKWTASIEGITADTLLNAGKYVVAISGAKLVNGTSELDDAVVVEPVVITVNPAQIQVVPTANATVKTYGDEEGVYGFGFDVVSVNGVAIAAGGSYAGISYEDIKAAVNGAYVRAVYDSKNEHLSFASRYDDATDATGTIFGTDGRYYSYAIGTAFSIDNNNFGVQAVLDLDTRLLVEQKEIEIETKYFVGLSKVEDGNDIVPYSETERAYDLSRHLVLATDDVKLVVTANYDSASIGANKTIVFTDLTLGGTKAYNYKLASVLNNGAGTDVNGSSEKISFDIDAETFVSIIWIDNENGVGFIRISQAAIDLLKSDFTVGKQYDNTTDLTIDHIAFGKETLQNANKYMASESSFPGKNVSDNYTVNIAVFFENIQNASITTSDSDITVTTQTNGVLITVKNLKSSITKRRIDRNSFEYLDAVDRDYNATKSVELEYTFKSDALATGDKAQTVGLQLRGTVEDANVGSSKAVTIDAANCKVSDSNYIVDAESIGIGYQKLDVNIYKARLVPNIVFNGREYNGKSDLEKGTSSDDKKDWNTVSGDGTFTSAQYADNLKDELALFSFDSSKLSLVLSLNGVANAEVQANGKHNVLVSGLEITFAGTEEQKENVLKNYRLDGSVYSKTDGKYNQLNTLSLGAVEDFELIDAFDLSKKAITLKANDFGVNNKYYDGTTEVNIAIDIDDGRILDEHVSLLEVVAGGAYARRQVGKNIEIVLSTATLKAKDSLSDEEFAKAQAAIGNYELVQYKGVLTGDINARPLLVSANLGEKEYNGDETVVKNNIRYTFTGMIAGDEKFYAIQTRNNAFFIDKNVEVERNAAGEPVYDTNGNVTVLAKNGTAYNLRLSNSKELYENYTLVYNSNVKLEGKEIVAYVIGQDVFFGAPASDATNVDEYWYNLETTKYFVAATPENKETYKDAIVGFYKNGTDDVYMLDKAYAEGRTDTAIGKLDDEINYLQGEGKITQRSVYIRANGITRKADSDKFTKVYDGTDKFFGVLGTDFEYNATAVANVVSGDSVEIANVSAKFDSAYTNAKYVVFTASGITGDDAYNYTIEGKAVSTVNLEGKIQSRTINAYLADATAEYGVSTGRFGGEVEYKLVGNTSGKEYALVNEYANDSAFYILLADYLEAVGFASADAELFADNTYSRNENGVFVKAAEGVVGEYVRLGGDANDRIASLPQAYVSFRATMPDAGTEASSFRFISQGNAKNFDFVGVYTDASETNKTGTSSKLSVVKKDLFVVTVSNGYSKKYGVGAMPNVELLYLDRTGSKGIVGGQSVITLFKLDTTNYYPVVKLGIYNSATGETKAATDMAKISSDLGENEHYVFYLEAPAGVDYATLNTMVKNYNVILGGIETISHKMVDVDGVQTVRTIFDMTDDGALVRPETATLEITLPKLEGISVGSDSTDKVSYVYAIDKNNQGINRLRESVKGIYDTDEVSFVGADGELLNPVNVGTYSGKINVRRYINANGEFVTEANKDDNGYYIEWNSGDVQKEIEITKASIGLRASNVSEYYNGKNHVYDSKSGRIVYNTLTGNDSLISTDYSITYEVLADGKYQATTKDAIVNAGKYRVTVHFDPSSRDGDDLIRVNYEPATVMAELQVLRAIVNVTVSDEGYTRVDGSADAEKANVHNFTAAYVKGKKYTVSYDVAMDAQSNDESIAITKAQTKLVGLDNVASAGKYAFAIELDDANLNANNYVFMKGTGMIELTTTKLDTDNGNTIEITKGEGVVANKLEVKEIKSNDRKTVDDMTYLDAVENYVASMKVENARVAAVYRVNLYLDDQLVLLSDNVVKVTVSMPDSLKSLDGIAIYYVNQNGGLTMLKLAADGNNLQKGEYTVNADGKIEYATDYINGIVFVDTTQEQLATWKKHAIFTGVALFAIIVIATSVTLIVKKSKLKKLA